MHVQLVLLVCIGGHSIYFNQLGENKMATNTLMYAPPYERRIQ